MILREYQQNAVDAVYAYMRTRTGNPCVVAPTGSGKSPMIATICRDVVTRWRGRVLVLAHVKELLEQTAATLRKIDDSLDIGVYSAGLNRRDTGNSIVVAGIQSVHKKACELDAFDLVIVDECFPAGALISTPRGDVPIEKLYVGQPIYHASGVGEIEAISSRPATEIVQLELSDGRYIRCTPNHLFYTESGWHEAGFMAVGTCLFRREDLSRLPEGISSNHPVESGREFALHDECQAKRSTASTLDGRIRVVAVTHIKLESAEVVYNLQVKGHPSYFADGVLVHNCHLLPPDREGMYRTFLNDAKIINPKIRLVGLTATPYRLKSGLLCGSDNLLTDVCYEIGVRELMDQGYLSPLRSRAGRHRLDCSKLHTRAGEFIPTELEKLVESDDHVDAACREIVTLTADRHSVLIFAVSVSHATRIRERIEKYAYCECGLVIGSTPKEQRDRTLRRFRGERFATDLLGGETEPLKYLVNVGVLTTGFDAPNIDCVVLLRPTLSPGLYAQMCGRGFRRHESKTDCLVLDYGGNILRHGPVDAIRVKERDSASSGGGGDAPARECPKCCTIVHASVVVCPECGFEFPPPVSKIERTAHVGGILSGEKTEIEYDVKDVYYSVHVKRGADGTEPRTVRVEYKVSFGEWYKEWVCPEHHGYSRAKFERWWAERSRDPAPDDAELVVQLADEGRISKPERITVRHTAGRPFPEIVQHVLPAKRPEPIDLSEVPF